MKADGWLPASAAAVPWWLWPTVLSIDAPVVALLWQRLLAGAAGVTVSWAESFVLVVSVWLAWAGDRWIEGWRLAPDQIRTRRHFFYQRHRWPVFIVAVALLTADIGVAIAYLSTPDIQAGLLLTTAALTYLLSHQLIHRGHPWRVPKEACIAVLLGAGVGLFLLTSPSVVADRLLPPLGLFVLLAFANCALISAWEPHVDRSHGQTSLALQFPQGAQIGRAAIWLIVPGALLLWLVGDPSVRPAALAAAASALLLAGVDLVEPRLGPGPARVLADVALMTPALPLLATAAGWT